jgi:hypothetical protein
MGFGSINVYRAPTYDEARYQVFTAVVLGIKKVLFWMDEWGETTNYQEQVTKLIGQIQAIGSEMSAGTTNDPDIRVSVTNKDKLVYRYGVSGNRHVLLAVNIARRTRVAGATLTNVRFSLPPEINATHVVVLDENRTLTVVNNSFLDHFKPFEVHVYAIKTSAAPPTVSTSQESFFPAGFNTAGGGSFHADNLIDGLRLQLYTP